MRFIFFIYSTFWPSFFYIIIYFRFAVGISAYGIHFSSKFVNFNIFAVAAIKEATAFVVILLIVPFFKMVGNRFMITALRRNITKIILYNAKFLEYCSKL